ncbi:MAG: ABC transporter ATP-binding protein [Acidimicrobiia bacterium]|nr:ABC transporter ATP-binding protein [Acidimicrobiia bacterium]
MQAAAARYTDAEVILLQKVSKHYALYRRPSDRLLETIPLFGRRRHTDFWALKDVSFKVETGEFAAIIGPNGSGKSTLLQLVAGIARLSSGRIRTEGRIAALLELGAGFNPEFTGRENVALNSEILGLTKRQIKEVFPRIEAFADIGEFIDRPVKEYSSGMYIRLAFSTAIHVQPDILIVDEALAVGDAIFANRCMQKFEELKQRGVTVLFVSHDLGLVKRLADRAILLLNGRVEMDGPPSQVVNHYVGLVHEWERRHDPRPAGAGESLKSSNRHGDQKSRIVSVEILDGAYRPLNTVETGAQAVVRVRAEFLAEIEEPMVGILIRNRLGVDVFGTNTRVEGRKLGNFEAGEVVEVEFRFPCLLAQQDYTLTAATQHWDGSSQDWLDDVLSFTVVDRRAVAGLASFPVEVSHQRIPAESAARL